MTLVEASIVVKRWWWLVGVGLVITAGLAIFVVRPSVVYTAKVDVLLLIPYSPDGPNVLQARTAALIATAGIVADDINGPSGGPQTVGGVSLADQGLNDDWSVRLPNSGGQWDNNFADPVLNVEATGSNADAARTRLDELVDRIRQDLALREKEAGVPEQNQIRSILSPSVPEVNPGVSRTTQARVVMALLGVLVTLLGVYGLDKLSHRRRSRRRQPSVPPGVRRPVVARPREDGEAFAGVGRTE